MVRVSGRGVQDIAARVCPRLEWSRARVLQLVGFLDAEGDVLERGTAVVYHGPRSATGEDVLEVTVHGSPYLVRRLEELFTAAGARPAEPGEFTRRAVANGKLDLVQAEAIRDLVDADTVWQARMARRQLDGVLSQRFDALRTTLVDLQARLEAALDFEGHGIGLDVDGVEAGRRDTLAAIDRLIATARVGERVRQGARVAIIGPPNAGKSTLFNALVGRERAIVAPTPGTTRDVLEAELDVAGVPVVVVDTAGMRDGGDAVEAEGRRRAQAEAERADLVLLLWPADGARPPEPRVANVVRVWSKADLASGDVPDGWIPCAAVRGEGVEEMRAAIEERVTDGLAQLDDPVAVDLRHREALERARQAVARAPLVQPELAADDLTDAIRAVEELVGAVGVEDVLDAIFRTFCIGK
jgi:tRNA modification GTPase